MGRTQSFKDEFTFEQRLEESQDIIAKYPDRVPVIVERYCKTDLPEMEKKNKSNHCQTMEADKHSCVHEISGSSRHVCRLSSRLHSMPGKALFVIVKNILPQTATVMDSIYESFKDEAGSEKTFGQASTCCSQP